MLRFYESQMSTLADANLDGVARDLVPYFREFHENATMDLDDDALFNRVSAGLRRARSWDFESMFAQILFVAIMLEVAPDFDTDPHIRAALEDGTQPLDDRLAGIGDALSEAGWEAVSARGNPAAWEG